MSLILSEEQRSFIDKALEGNNILVDACIGSGKTTSIQYLCNQLPQTKNILYLTYNRLLKIDAKSKIHNKNVTVQNYHGYAYNSLSKINIKCGTSELIQYFNKYFDFIPCDQYDLLIIDEYQDITTEISHMLSNIVKANPQIQIVAVGDMQQKIYDFSSLDVLPFIEKLLNKYIKLSFTNCFRLPQNYAHKLGQVWKKEIIGTNNNCSIEYMSKTEIINFLSTCEPKDILCLGSRNRSDSPEYTDVLNSLETEYSHKFNKHTVYASISDNDSNSLIPKIDSAIFTTYDSSKGLERRYCIIFDFDLKYWEERLKKEDQKYEILRNIFCVAASRGKEKIIFCQNNHPHLQVEDLLNDKIVEKDKTCITDISKMFDYRHEEDIESCFNCLKVSKLPKKTKDVINVENKDGLIDISPCIGELQESLFFGNYNIDTNFKFYSELYPRKKLEINKHLSLSTEKKILWLTSFETNQDRYFKQVTVPFISEEDKKRIKERLSERLSPDDQTQVPCSINFSKGINNEPFFIAKGLADTVKDGVVYELKFVSELKHTHFLQCAMYMICLKLQTGILWNTRNNDAYSIEIPDKSDFFKKVVYTISSHKIDKLFSIKINNLPDRLENPFLKNRFKFNKNEMDLKIKRFNSHLENVQTSGNYYAIIDTETNCDDCVMSLGIVISGQFHNFIDAMYFTLIPHSLTRGMYSDRLHYDEIPELCCTRKIAIDCINKLFSKYRINYVFAYNASFDQRHLPELNVIWIDIAKTVAYKQYNPFFINSDILCHSTGKLIKFSLDVIMHNLGESNYFETHNAILDAIDEFTLMQMTKMSSHWFIENNDKSNLERKNDFINLKDVDFELEYSDHSKNCDYISNRFLCLKQMEYLNSLKQKKERKKKVLDADSIPTAEELDNLYHIQKLSIPQIADKYKTNTSEINEWIKIRREELNKNGNPNKLLPKKIRKGCRWVFEEDITEL